MIWTAIGWLRGNIVAILIAALAIVLAWGMRVDHLRAGYKDALATTISRYTQAQKDAQAAFDAKVAASVARNKELNREADDKAVAATIVYRDRVVRLQSATSCGPAGGSDVSTSNVPASADRSSGDSIVSIKRADALICADNTGRLEAAHGWAISMASGD